jgi:hypothetical protein
MTIETSMTAPKLFVSYSWANRDTDQWVLELAKQLKENGVDVILDKWNLSPGQDTYRFMESMVGDTTIRKVVMICDLAYVEKANKRSGGVGSETLIISDEVYKGAEQSKFVAIIREKTSDGKILVPTYYKGRLHIDLSDDQDFATGYETLLRWCHDKPLYVAPGIGDIPDFIKDNSTLSLGTNLYLSRCVTSFREGKASALGNLSEYFTVFATNLERFRIVKPQQGEYDDLVIKSIHDLLPARNEAIQIFQTIARFSEGLVAVRELHKFFERLLRYYEVPAGTTQYSSTDFDNYLFLVQELFLYAIAILLEHGRLEEVAHLFDTQYFAPDMRSRSEELLDFTRIQKQIETFEIRKSRLKSNRISLFADLMQERNHGTGISFEHLIQADFVAYCRSVIPRLRSMYWYPELMNLRGRHRRTFELFARAKSNAFFLRAKKTIAVDSVKEIQAFVERYSNPIEQIPRFERGSDIGALLGVDFLCAVA